MINKSGPLPLRWCWMAWLAAAVPAHAALTVDQATRLSRTTGRPILAVAGSKT